MKKRTHDHKMLFYVSDAHHKEKSDDVCCCGCPPHFKVFKGQFAGALQKVKHSQSKTIHWSEIDKENKEILSDVPFEAVGFNTSSSALRATRRKQSMHDYMRDIWNTPSSLKSPYGYFEKIMYPTGLDEEGNVIYKYWKEKAGE